MFVFLWFCIMDTFMTWQYKSFEEAYGKNVATCSWMEVEIDDDYDVDEPEPEPKIAADDLPDYIFQLEIEGTYLKLQFVWSTTTWVDAYNLNPLDVSFEDFTQSDFHGSVTEPCGLSVNANFRWAILWRNSVGTTLEMWAHPRAQWNTWLEARPTEY